MIEQSKSSVPTITKEKRESRMYFTPETEKYIILYNKCEDELEKEMMFNHHIMYPLHKLSENILNTFKFQYFDSTQDDVINEVTSFLVLNLHKFQEGKGKAFSYFSVVAKNYLILKNNNNYKRYKRTTLLSETEGIWEIPGDFNEIQRKEEISEFVYIMLDYWDDNIYRTFKKDRDIAIADAILELFRRSDNIENFNKKALYLSIREMTGCKTQYITKVINKMKLIQRKMYTEFLLSGDISNIDEAFWP